MTEGSSSGRGGGGGSRGLRKHRGPKQSQSSCSGGGSTKKIKDDVSLVVAVAATGRTPLNGWVLSLGAVAITTQTRRVLGTFARNFLPLLPHTNIEPAADVTGYLRKHRAELELFYRRGTQVTVEQGMRDLKAFCDPYANLTLVASPLFSVYGWLSYYWTHTFPATGESLAPAMPWGFSGVCAKSHASGRLGMPVKGLAANAAYQASFEGYRSVGIPLGDALAAAVSFTCLGWPTGEAAPPLPPVSFACELPAILAELGCVPASAPAAVAGEIVWSSALPGTLTKASTTDKVLKAGCEGENAREAEAGAATPTHFPAPRPILECVVDKASILDGLASTEGILPAATFVEYPSITDVVHYGEFIDHLPRHLVDEVEWVATEKVHGSNFTIFCDGEKLWAAKRTGYVHLKDSGGFFEFVYLMEEARPALLKAYQLVVEWWREQATAEEGVQGTEGGGNTGTVVAFMCELAGGVYPHPNVPVDLRGGRVQNGVYYSPKNFLYGFDIAIEGVAGCARCDRTTADAVRGSSDGDRVSSIGKDGRLYLPVDHAARIFQESGFEAYARPLHRGPLRQLLDLPLEFPSTIADQQLGLPPILSRKNEAEGYVLRPACDVWVRLSDSAALAAHARRHGSGGETESAAWAGGKQEAEPPELWARAILKRKHPRFDEFATANSATSLRQHQEMARAEGGLVDNEETVAVDLAPFLTAGRVESVLSKYTEDECADQSRMVAAVLADALKDAHRFSSEHRTHKK